MNNGPIWKALALVVVAASSRMIAGCGGDAMPGADGAVDGAADAATNDVMTAPSDVRVPPGTPTPIQWNTTAQSYRGMNGLRFYLRCPSMGQYGIVFGTATYTDSSSICTAAVHDRRITIDAGGDIEIEISPGRSAYMGSRGGGVTSGDWDAWEGSFSFSSPARMMD